MFLITTACDNKNVGPPEYGDSKTEKKNDTGSNDQDGVSTISEEDLNTFEDTSKDEPEDAESTESADGQASDDLQESTNEIEDTEDTEDTEEIDDPLVCVGTPDPDRGCGDPFCDTMPGCTVNEQAVCDGVSAVCSAYDNDEESCEDQWGCDLGANGRCGFYISTCDDIYSYDDCESIPGCWSSGDGYCFGDMEINCDSKRTEAACGSHFVCLWTPSEVAYCAGVSIACEDMASDTCEMQTGCTLTPATCSGAPTPCEALSIQDCLMQPGCSLSSGETRYISPEGISTDGPDLVFDTFTVSRVPYSDTEDALDLAFGEINRGNESAAVHESTLFLSLNDVYGDDDDYPFFTITVDFELLPYGFEPGFLDTYIEMPAPVDVPPGNYHVIGVLDSSNTVTELEEDNNVMVLPPVFVGPNTYDLIATSSEHGVTGTIAPGVSFELFLGIENASTKPIIGLPIDTYLSEDQTLDDSDIPVVCTGTLAVELDSQESGTFTLACSLPRARGTFYLISELDPDDILSDADRTNNVAVSAQPVTVDAPSPDLQITALTADVDTVEWQGSITVTATIENTGPDPSPAASVNIYAAAGGALLGSAEVDPLDAGASQEISVSCTLAAGVVGTFTLFAHVDETDEIFELDETNNTMESASGVTVSTPDYNLAASGVGIVAGGTERSAGQSLTVYIDIENDGTEDAPAFQFIVYASVDTTISQDDNELCIFDVNDGQAAGTTTDGMPVECTVPTLPTGEYYVGLIVDTEQSIPETREPESPLPGWISFEKIWVVDELIDKTFFWTKRNRVENHPLVLLTLGMLFVDATGLFRPLDTPLLIIVTRFHLQSFL